MKTSDFSRQTLSACVAATLLAGCGGSQPPVGLPPPASVAALPPLDSASPSTGTSPHEFRGEAFSGTTLHVTCRRGQYQFYTVDFEASGLAKGPFPGEFTAEGWWIFNKFVKFWRFHEHFTLVSKNRMHSGYLYNHGPVIAHCDMLEHSAYYSLPRRWHGRVNVQIDRVPGRGV
jgi:hypothetical protein